MPKIREVSKTRFKTRFAMEDAKPLLSLMSTSKVSSSVDSSCPFYLASYCYLPQPPSLLHTPDHASPGSALFHRSELSPMAFQLYFTLHSCVLPRPHGKVAAPQASPVLTYIFPLQLSLLRRSFLLVYQAISSFLLETVQMPLPPQILH